MKWKFIVIALTVATISGIVRGEDDRSKINRYKREIDSLKTIRKTILSNIDSKIDSLNKLCVDIELLDIGGNWIVANTTRKADIRPKPGMVADVIRIVPKKSEVFIIDYAADYYLIIYDGTKGYISDHTIQLSENSKRLLLALHKKKAEEKKEKLRREQEARREKRLEQQKKDEALTQRLNEIKNELEREPAWVVVEEANVRSASNPSSKILRKMMLGDKTFIQARDGNWVIIKTRDTDQSVHRYPDSTTFVNSYDDGWIYRTLISNNQSNVPTHKDLLRNKYLENNPNIDSRFRYAIKQGRILIGMTEEMVIVSIGYPKKRNRSVYEFGVHEQWIYSNRYVYFEDGHVKSWQD